MSPFNSIRHFHVYNKPDFQSKGLTLTLSFDALYTCSFPWESISQVVFQPKKAEIVEEDSSEDVDSRDSVSKDQDMNKKKHLR